ncbi:hypothetical protein [Paracidovorax cattleyae]|uniref:hypothetical protein n=1 Tax=Paracidovorax cattleyae TaxID=80868 RepID=UPI001E296C96|nr:hypothetical protein [Paracidovorax cattleyae]
MHDLNAIAPGALDVQIAGRVQALKVELSKADAFIRSAAQNVFAANQIEALGKNLGAIIGAAELLYKMKGDNFTTYDFGETGLGLVGASIGVGLATLVGAPVVATFAVGIGAGFASKWLWEKKIAPELGWSDKNSPLFWDALFDAMGLNPSPDASLNLKYLAARNWTPPRDPLVLDLDGDGIEAVGIDPSRPILFDHDGDGTRNATGWIKGDDGIVVLDRNGNGLIDSGRELFGDQTLREGAQAGQGMFYANGYEALAGQDGNGDGVIDAADTAYGQLRIWKDVNQDGISQAGELHTLSDLGIARLNAKGQRSSIDLGNGNTQPWSGSFTRMDGSQGMSGVAEVSGSLLLASNNFYREFPDDPVPTAAAQALPQMGGAGWARDLREAMSLGNDKSQALQDKVQAFAAGTTRDAQMAASMG